MLNHRLRMLQHVTDGWGEKTATTKSWCWNRAAEKLQPQVMGARTGQQKSCNHKSLMMEPNYRKDVTDMVFCCDRRDILHLLQPANCNVGVLTVPAHGICGRHLALECSQQAAPCPARVGDATILSGGTYYREREGWGAALSR